MILRSRGVLEYIFTCFSVKEDVLRATDLGGKSAAPQRFEAKRSFFDLKTTASKDSSEKSEQARSDNTSASTLAGYNLLETQPGNWSQWVPHVNGKTKTHSLRGNMYYPPAW